MRFARADRKEMDDAIVERGRTAAQQQGSAFTKLLAGLRRSETATDLCGLFGAGRFPRVIGRAATVRALEAGVPRPRLYVSSDERVRKLKWRKDSS